VHHGTRGGLFAATGRGLYPSSSLRSYSSSYCYCIWSPQPSYSRLILIINLKLSIAVWHGVDNKTVVIHGDMAWLDDVFCGARRHQPGRRQVALRATGRGQYRVGRNTRGTLHLAASSNRIVGGGPCSLTFILLPGDYLYSVSLASIYYANGALANRCNQLAVT